MRSALAVVVSLGLVASLAACSAPSGGGAASTSTACAPVPSGEVSDAVKVTGEFGAKPTIAFDSPLQPTATERTVVIEGKGDVAQPGGSVNVNFTILNGATGAELTSTEFGETGAAAVPLDPKQFITGVVSTLQCSSAGSRVVGAIPASEAFGDQGSTQLGVQAGESLVFVADVVSVSPPADPPLPRANGTDQPPQDGFPTVVLDDTGRPTITIPDAAPPTEFQLAVLKQGDGATVQDGDTVTVHYVGMNWASKEIFDESWARGEPASFPTSGVIEGFRQALVGQQVGSQVIAVIPPALGYGDGPDAKNGTIVFVVDILGIG